MTLNKFISSEGIMNTNILKKLKSSSGVTILVALLAFMVAAMISAVLVNAALTNTKRVAQTKKQNQEYLIVESAAKMIKSILYNCCVVFECVEESKTSRITSEDGVVEDLTETSNWNNPENIKTYKKRDGDDSEEDVVATPTADGESSVISSITESVVACISSGSSSSGQHTILLEGDGIDSKNVTFEVIFNDDFGFELSDSGKMTYNFDFVIKLPVGNPDSSVLSNAMTIEAVAKCEEYKTEYEEGDFAEDEEKEGIEVRSDTIIHCYRITWDNFLIKKGNYEHDSTDPETT